LYPLSNFDRLYLRQYRSYEQASKHRSASFWPEKGFWTSSGCHRYFFSDPQSTPSQMYSRGEKNDGNVMTENGLKTLEAAVSLLLECIAQE
jgi:hypothetical protein